MKRLTDRLRRLMGIRPSIVTFDPRAGEETGVPGLPPGGASVTWDEEAGDTDEAPAPVTPPGPLAKPDAAAVVAAMEAKGYRVFRAPWSLNIVGLRHPSRVAGAFDDLVGAFWWDDAGELDCAWFAATTDPGIKYLEGDHPQAGTAILIPGQYPGAYKIGIHREGKPGAHRALVQRGGVVTVWRDPSGDHTLDREGREYTGYFGINIHQGQNSAGCQMIPDKADWRAFMGLVDLSASRYGDTFTYTLLDWQ